MEKEQPQLISIDSNKPHHETIYDILLDQDEITWQSLIHELVKTNQMDPWDIDVSQLSRTYIDVVKKMKEMDLRVSGKVVLAAAILLKIKSTRLLKEDITQFDNMMSGQDEDSLFDEEGLSGEERRKIRYDGLRLIPKTPQPRARKVSIYDLVEALQQALETKRRRLLRERDVPQMEIPEKKIDISVLMKNLYGKVLSFFTSDSGAKLTFSQLIPSERKEDKIMTFIPLLHLCNNRKIDLHQEKPFEEIEIRVSNVREINKELGDLGEV
ncbi:segregation/condensation protein A [candidate division KSB1 bacterium]